MHRRQWQTGSGTALGLRRIRRGNLGWILVLGASLFAGTTEGLGEVLAGEADAPVEQCESSQPLAIIAPSSPKRGDADSQAICQVAVSATGPRTAALKRAAGEVVGHRLVNGLCAPLRC